MSDPGESLGVLCVCSKCGPPWRAAAEPLQPEAFDLGGVILKTWMALCPTCGNKRCPRAADHNNECSGSNTPGQQGSNYPVDPWAHLRDDDGEIRSAVFS